MTIFGPRFTLCGGIRLLSFVCKDRVIMITHHRPFMYFRRIVTAALAFLAVLVLLPAALYVLYANDCDAIKGYHPLSLETAPDGKNPIG